MPVTETGCWLWLGTASPRGYGRCMIDANRQRAHRAAFAHFIGPVPNGMLVCHRCDTPSCINPKHLFLGTSADNVHDMVAKGRGVNPRGEEHVQARITNADVAEMRRLRQTGMSYGAIGKQFGMCPAAASDVIVGRRWGHLKSGLDLPRIASLRLKLNDDTLAEIAGALDRGETQRSVAARYHVSQGSISRATTAWRARQVPA